MVNDQAVFACQHSLPAWRLRRLLRQRRSADDAVTHVPSVNRKGLHMLRNGSMFQPLVIHFHPITYYLSIHWFLLSSRGRMTNFFAMGKRLVFWLCVTILLVTL
jgi:hypothetical protein